MGGSLVAQLVKNPAAMLETWVRSLSWKDPLEKGKATHSSILAWRIPWGHKESDMTEWLSFHYAHLSKGILKQKQSFGLLVCNLEMQAIQ